MKPELILLILAFSFQPLAFSTTFPVKFSSNSRYLVDQNNVPFPIKGRTSWFVLSLSAANYQTYIDDTVARGYNVVELHVLNHDARGNNEPLNGNGDQPFINKLNGSAWAGALTYGTINNEAPDFTTPVTAYWTFVDAFLAYCETKGVLVFMFPAYTGFNGGDQGWMMEMVANGPTKVQTYGAWIATRYVNQKNIVWMLGGDMGYFDTDQLAAEQALITGIKSVSSQQSTNFSAEWYSSLSSAEQPDFGSHITLNGAYDWDGDVSHIGRTAYDHGGMPSFLLEEPYDEEGPEALNVNPSATQPVRRFQYWGWLSTIGGYVSGNGYVWQFNTGYSSHLNTTGTQDMTRLNNFIDSINWYRLVPSGLDGMQTLVTAGGSTVSATDYVTAASDPSGTLLVAYIPPAHTGSITIAMTAMSGTCRARWFDPTNATYSDIGSYANTGTRAFTPTGNNSAGEADWVLVLDIPSTAQVRIRKSPAMSARRR